ncbi:unnamed protein product [Caenorhabditis angaria]|uniref:Uncharacterized protein n=1 Tax=Caenorhabditis angaria TaxID=860376 RepID=A0A9P1MYD4_9PELO|nr:unnamed protein product [Caenorhabditis angaria]
MAYDFVPKSAYTTLFYLFLSISSILYYSMCFLANFGAQKSHLFWLTEHFLWRVCLTQWCILAIFGAVFWRKIRILYLYLAVLAGNGTMVLWILKIQQFLDGRIDLMNIHLNLISLLFFFAILHNFTTFYIFHRNLAKNSKKSAIIYYV